MVNFWYGFILGLISTLGIAFVCIIWVIIQAASFHDTWMSEKEENPKN